jgi:L-amino acid N-acyltransferase YncA
MTLSIRAASSKDLDAINTIYNHYVDVSTCTWQYAHTTADERHAWFVDRPPTHPVIVAERAGEVVGYGSLGPFRPREGYRFTVENSVYVHPERQRLGIGGALLADLLERAQKLQLKTVMAGISAEQTGSIALHARYGFVEVGRLPSVGFKHDQWLDLLLMQRQL